MGLPPDLNAAAGFVVILASDHTDDQAKTLMIGLACMKGVLMVTPIPPNDSITEARERIRKGLEVRIKPILEKMEN